MMKPLRIISFAAAACLLGSCNTFIGMGKDIQSLGHGMVNAGHHKPWGGKRAPAAPETPQNPAPPAPAP